MLNDKRMMRESGCYGLNFLNLKLGERERCRNSIERGNLIHGKSHVLRDTFFE